MFEQKLEMLKRILVLCVLLIHFNLNAQYTNVINSNRPGFSESPYSVGKGVYQLEAGLFYASSKIVPTFTRPESFGANFVFRTSFFLDKLEFNTNITYQRDKVAFKNVFTSHYFSTGISKLTLGAKYLVYQPTYKDKSKEIRSWKRRQAFDWKRTIPSVAVYVGLNTNFLSPVYKLEGMTPKAGILLQQNLSDKLNIVTNVFYDYIGSDYSEISYIITGTYSMNDYWSTFLEHQGIINEYQTNYNFGTGVAYLFNRHFQVDASARMTFDGNVTGLYGGLGLSYRLDRHQDEYKLVDEYGNEIKEVKQRSGKKNFLSRFFNFFNFSKSKKKATNSKGKTTRKRKKASSKKSKKRKRKKSKVKKTDGDS